MCVILVGGRPFVASVHTQQQQQSTVELIIGESVGAQPRLAVPRCLALTDDPVVVEASETIASVVWDDLEFEREFRMVPRDTYDTIPVARGTGRPSPQRLGRARVPMACSAVLWTAPGDDQIRVMARLFNVRSA